MWIIGIIILVIGVIVVLLRTENISTDATVTTDKKDVEKVNNPILKERSLPWFYVKNCKFYADTSSLFSYDQKDLDVLFEKYDDCEKFGDYDELIKICDEIIVMNYKIRKVWVDKINAVFNSVMKNKKEWNESSSRLIVNACYGFMKTFDTVLERSIGVKHILLPILLKNIDNMANYQRKQFSELYNLELYNMLINLFYLIPFRQILDVVSKYLIEAKLEKNLEKEEYAKRSIKSLLGHINMLKGRYTLEKVEYEPVTNHRIRINDTVVINDEIFNTTWVGFSVTFPKNIKKVELICKFFDERYQEIVLDTKNFKQYSDLFEIKKADGGLEEFEIVILGEDLIKTVELSIYNENNDVIQEISETKSDNNVDVVKDKKDNSSSKNMSKKSIVDDEIKLKQESDKKNTSKVKTFYDNQNKEEIEENSKIEDIEAENVNYEKEEVKVDNIQEEKKEESKNQNEVEQDEVKEEFELLAFPDFENIKDIAISELHWVCLKNDGKVEGYGENNNLTELNSWENIDKIYVTNFATYGIKKDRTIVVASKNSYDFSDHNNLWTDILEIISGQNYVLGLRGDGTVLAVGNNDKGQCDVESWKDIVSVSASFHSVGLKRDGTVLAVGENKFGECNVDKWTDIIQVETGPFYTIGLKKDGTVLATGLNSCGQCNVEEWKNIKKIYARGNITAGLGFDGKVWVTGSNSYRFEDVKKWQNIQDIKIVNDRILGIKEDGTVVYKGKPYKGVIERTWTNIKKIDANSNCVIGLTNDNTVICNNLLFGMYIPGIKNMPLDIKYNKVNGKAVVLNKDKTIEVFEKNNDVSLKWEYSRFYDISSISLSDTHLVGLKTDGTAVLTGLDSKMAFDVESWRNLVKVEMGSGFCIGLKIDGKVVATGDNFFGQCDVSWWKDIVDIKVSNFRTFGLKADGSVVFAGFDEFEEQEFVKLFDNVVEFAVNKKQVMLLDANGNVAVSKHPEGLSITQLSVWNNIKHIMNFGEDFIGIKDNGTIVSTIDNASELEVWNSIKHLETNDMYILGKKVSY